MADISLEGRLGILSLEKRDRKKSKHRMEETEVGYKDSTEGRKE